MRRRWRWSVVGAVVAVLVALPFVVSALPVARSAVDARTLLARIRASVSVPWSGYAQSTGGLALPVSTGAFSVNDLLGGTSRLRVWWRGGEDFRVDSIGATGETDLHRTPAGTWTWDYEADTAQWVRGGAQVRLPRSDDLVPAALARRLLGEADPGDVTRLPAMRIAGQVAAGLRLHIADVRSTVRHVDVWALPGDGLPVRVAVFGAGRTPVVTTTLYDLDLTPPARTDTAFRPPVGSMLREGGPSDIVSAIDQFGRSTPPRTLVGLPWRRDLHLGAVGVYGRGVTLLVAVPLSPRLAGQVVPQLRHVPGVVEDSAGIGVGVGPIGVHLSAPTGYGSRWLLVGTLTRSALRQAATALPPAQGFGFFR